MAEDGTLEDRITTVLALVQSVYVSDIYVANDAFFNILSNVLGHKGARAGEEFTSREPITWKGNHRGVTGRWW